MDVCVYVCVCPGITLESLERFQPNLVHTLLYVCVRIYVCFIYIYLLTINLLGNLDIYIVEDIKLLLLLGNRLVMTSRLATLVRRIQVSIFVATIKMDVCVCVFVCMCMFQHNSGTPREISSKL
jgi:hypothetical protein